MFDMSLDQEDDSTPESRSARGFFFARDADGPVITAAGKSNSAELEMVLLRAGWLLPLDRSRLALDWVHDEYSGDGRIDTPLLRAIKCQVYKNVQILLQGGANPNGIPMEFQEQYSRGFRRFKSHSISKVAYYPIDPKDVCSAQTQMFPLMETELLARRATISRFWSESDTHSISAVENGDKLHALVMAAATTPAIFKLLLDAGADATFWIGNEIPRHLPGDHEMTPSALCLSTPLHHAICAGNLSMLENLLAHNFNPNAQALIAGCQAFTPMQQAVLAGNIEAVRILDAHPRIDLNRCTPVYKVQVFHLVAAKLDVELFDQLTALGVPNGPVTALNHNLAHVACMPFSDIDIQFFAPKVRESIHEIRSLNPMWRPNYGFRRAAERHHLARIPRVPLPGYDPDDDYVKHELNVSTRLALPVEQRRHGPADSLYFELPSTEHFDRQLAFARKLGTAIGMSLFTQHDYCGNTALHYLASARIINSELVNWLSVELNFVWRSSKNAWFHTPQDLWIDNVTTMEVGERPPRRKW